MSRGQRWQSETSRLIARGAFCGDGYRGGDVCFGGGRLVDADVGERTRAVLEIEKRLQDVLGSDDASASCDWCCHSERAGCSGATQALLAATGELARARPAMVQHVVPGVDVSLEEVGDVTQALLGPGFRGKLLTAPENLDEGPCTLMAGCEQRREATGRLD